MQILVVAATFAEIEPLVKAHGLTGLKEGVAEKSGIEKKDVHFLVTGVGMVNTTYHMQRRMLRELPSLCINAGIAGSFSDEIKIGEVVRVKQDRFSELGAQDGDNFLTVDELKLGEQIVPSSVFSDVSYPILDKLRSVNAITVNTVHGNETEIKKTRTRFDPDVESMEGAAFMLICYREKIKHFQVRAVSNKVEKRNREAWNIPLAIKNLNEFLIDFLKTV